MFEKVIIWGSQVADEHETLTELSEHDRILQGGLTFKMEI